MLVFLTRWLFILAIATSTLMDRNYFSIPEIKVLAVPHFFVLGFAVVVLLRLIIEKKVRYSLKAILQDKATAMLFWGILALLFWQTLSNLNSIYVIRALKAQVKWIEIAGIIVTAVLAIEAGYLKNLKVRTIIIAIIVTHTINILFAVVQIDLEKEFFITGVTQSHHAFSILSVMFLCILLGTLSWKKTQNYWQRSFIILLTAATCFCLPFSGTRMGTMAFIVLVISGVIIIRQFRISLIVFCIIMFLSGAMTIKITTETVPRGLKINLPSTSTRMILLRTDLHILSQKPFLGCGMDSSNYKISVSGYEKFEELKKFDPPMYENPITHSAWAGLMSESGVPALIFFAVSMWGMLVIFWRSVFWAKDPYWGKVFLCSFFVFGCGFMHVIYGETAWILLAAGLVIAKASLPKNTAAMPSLGNIVKITLREPFIGCLNLLWKARKLFKRKKIKARLDVNSITFLGFIGLGDWLVVLPVLEALKKKFPAANITVLTNHLGEQTLKLSSVEIKTVVLPDFPRRVEKFIRIAFWLAKNRRKLSSELLFCSWWNPTHQFLSCLLPFKFFYGFFTCSGSGISQTQNMRYCLESNISGKKMTHMEKQWFGKMREILVSGLEMDISNTSLVYKSKKWPREQICQLDEHLVVCQPNSLFKNKSWDIERWLETLTGINNVVKITVILAGSFDDQVLCKKLYKSLKENNVDVLNICGQMSITELADVLRKANLFLGTDSGPAHLASHVGTQSVILYGPTMPENYLPIDFKGEVVYKKLDCSPCGIRHCLLSKKQQYLCMRRIQVDEVVYPAIKLLR